MNQGVLDTIYLVLTHPKDGLGEASRNKSFGWSLVVYTIAIVVWRGASILGAVGERTGILGSTGFLDIVLCAIAGLAVLFVTAGVLHLVARILRGHGSYSGLVCALAFAALPVVFFAPLSVLDVTLGTAGFVLYCVGGLALLVWAFVVLEVIALRENYGFSTRRALVTYFLPPLALFLLSAAVYGISLLV